MSPLAITLLAIGGVLWVVSLVAAIRGRNMTTAQRVLILVLLLIVTPIGAYLVLR